MHWSLRVPVLGALAKGLRDAAGQLGLVGGALCIFANPAELACLSKT
jgi:hypothetical protein